MSALAIKNYIDGCTKEELEYVQKYITEQIEKIEEAKPKLPKFNVLNFDDGCEGFYVRESRLNEIKPEQFFEFMTQTIEQGSELHITMDAYDEEEFLEICARYSWFDDEQDEWIKKIRDKDED